MQTSFSLAQLADPNIATADKILRACVHCGFCQATCPTGNGAAQFCASEVECGGRPCLESQTYAPLKTCR